VNRSLCGWNGYATRPRQPQYVCGCAVSGNFGDCKSVGDGVAELRVDVGAGYRVYYARHGRDIVILLCGGDKRTQDGDIQMAKRYWAEFKRRNA